MARVPRRQAILDLMASEGRPMHPREIASRLGVEEGEDLEVLELIDELAFEGTLLRTAGRRFRLPPTQRAARNVEVVGALSVNPRGFGFVSGGAEGDIYIAREAMGGALHGDTVNVRVTSRTPRGREGEVTSVVQRRQGRVAGILRWRGKSAWIEPDDARLRGPIVVTIDPSTEAHDGDAAVATITRFPQTPDENPEGEIVLVLGEPGDPNVEVAKILVREGVEEDHSEAAIAEAEGFGDAVDGAVARERQDLTALPLVTIDPEDARDHDDAVHVVRHDDASFTAWIAIADVAHYVRPGTALDSAALARGNSIYLPDRAIPMLPRALSSNLCSLLPNVPRLCLAVKVELDANATVQSFDVVEGVMISHARLTYPGVARALGLTEQGEPDAVSETYRDALRIMLDLARILRGRRLGRGALDLDLPEAKVVLDDNGAPSNVVMRARDPGVAKAYHLVEELMLLANECVARFLVEHGAPAVFRCHGAPDPEKLDKFATMAAELGVNFDLEDATEPKRLSLFLKKIAHHPKKSTLHNLLLRAMKQAAYDTNNIGHFGLASDAYLHFTSPIRRYADLVVHRIVRQVARKERVDTREPALEALRLAAVTASLRERRAMEVEREVVDLYRALYMAPRLGTILEGTVTGLVGSGVFVEVAEPFIAVLVRLEALGRDDYELDDAGLRVIGKRSGERIGIGDTMLVEIDDVSIVRRTVYGKRLLTSPRGDERPLDQRGREGRRLFERGAAKRVKATKTTKVRASHGAADRKKKGGKKRG